MASEKPPELDQNTVNIFLRLLQEHMKIENDKKEADDGEKRKRSKDDYNEDEEAYIAAQLHEIKKMETKNEDLSAQINAIEEACKKNGDNKDSASLCDDIEDDSSIRCKLCMRWYITNKVKLSEGVELFLPQCWHDICISCYSKVRNDPCSSCKGELKKASEEPHNLKYHALNEMIVKCARCKEQFKYGDYNKHRTECLTGIRTCKNKGCGQRIKNEQEHNLVCEFKDKNCELCKLLLKAVDFKDHKNNCPEVTVICKSSGCDFKASRKDYKDHDNTCQHKIHFCKGAIFGCNKNGKLDIIREHENTCILFPIDCKCGMKILRKNQQSHNVECKKFLIKCTNNCEMLVERDSLKKHCELDCPNVLVPCINDTRDMPKDKKCGLMLRGLLTEHLEQVCQNALILCEHKCMHESGTPMLIIRSEQKIHDKVCPNVDVKCKQCNTNYLRRDELKHFDTCEKMYCLCSWNASVPLVLPQKGRECFFQQRRDLMASHLEDHLVGRAEKENKEQIFEIGIYCDVMDQYGTWCAARIIDIKRLSSDPLGASEDKKETTEYFVRFLYKNNKHNIWVKNDKIAPYMAITKYSLYEGRRFFARFLNGSYYMCTVVSISDDQCKVFRDIDKKEHVILLNNNHETMGNKKMLFIGNIYDVVHNGKWVAARLVEMNENKVFFKTIRSVSDLLSGDADINFTYDVAIQKIQILDIYGVSGSFEREGRLCRQRYSDNSARIMIESDED
jgi:hypothetical protein